MQLIDYQGKSHTFDLIEVSGYRELKDFAFYGKSERCEEFEGKYCVYYVISNLDSGFDAVAVFYKDIDKNAIVFVPEDPLDEIHINFETFLKLKSHFS